MTSELGRVWLMVGVAWFFFLRGAPVAERMARSRNPFVSLMRYAWPLAFVAFVLVGAMLMLHDMGPLLIASYAAGAFLAASIAMWWHVRTGARYAPAVLAVSAFTGWIAIVTLAVFQFGAVHEVTAGRLENLAAPLASANDQQALVAWFREAAPANGFGLGGRALVRLYERDVRRRSGPDPQRLHVHGAGRCVRLVGGVGAHPRLPRSGCTG